MIINKHKRICTMYQDISLYTTRGYNEYFDTPHIMYVRTRFSKKSNFLLNLLRTSAYIICAYTRMIKTDTQIYTP